MKKIILHIILLVSFAQVTIQAQESKASRKSPYFRIAEKEFESQRYLYAIPFFKSTLRKQNTHDTLAMLHLAESYWQIRNFDSALAYYTHYDSKFGSQPYVKRRMAELYATKQQYSKAVAIYQNLLKESSFSDRKLLTQRLKGFSNITPLVQDSLDFTLHFLKLNTSQQEFSPQYFKNGLVFVSNRYPKKIVRNEFGWDGYPFAKIYWVKDTADLFVTDTMPASYHYEFNHNIKPNDDYTAITSNDNDIILQNSIKKAFPGEMHNLDRFSDALETKYNYGSLCFSKDGNTVYFTRNTKKAVKGRFNLEICEAKYENGEWTKGKVMPFVLPDYDFFHPALSNDEQRLYFCSNQPGGKGESDIYYVGLQSEDAKAISFNLGDMVNTSGNELFPTIHGENFYFSSDGWQGLGGQDIYKTSLVRNQWKAPVNLGYPINSSYDDFGIILNQTGHNGYFNSNRLGSDDIFAFVEKPYYFRLDGTVLNKANLRRLDSVQVVMHSVNNDNPTVDRHETDIRGIFNFPIKPGYQYSLHFSRRGFYEDSLQLTNARIDKDIHLEPVLLRPIPVKEPEVELDRDGDGIIDSKDKCPDEKGIKENFGCPDIQARLNELAKMVFFKTDKDELTPAAIKPLTEAYEILKTYANTTLVIEGHTDSRASDAHNLDLSRRRANSVKMFFVNKGLDAKRFTTFGYGESRPIADNETEEGRAMNRRVSIKATFYQ